MGFFTVIIVLTSRRPSKLTQEVFFGYVDLKKKRAGYPSVMSFEDRSASGSQRSDVDDSWVPLSLGPNLVNDETSFGLLQFAVLEVENALLELESSKDPGPDGVPPLIQKNCASRFALSL
jgi:hypothetical protein